MQEGHSSSLDNRFWWAGLIVWLVAIACTAFSIRLNLTLTAVAIALFILQAVINYRKRLNAHGS
jgi:hypothetical protein